MRDRLLEDLNPPQREAVTTTDGPLLIIAGAGSGKTRVITYRVAYLVQFCGVAPRQIFAATFTNKAADEMRERVRRLLASDRAMPFAISTFHAWCARVLRREAEKIGIGSDFTICDEDDQLSVLREVFRGMGLEPRGGAVLPTQARWAINQAKMRLEGPEDVRRQKRDRERAALYADIFVAYQQILRRNNALDFGDLIAEVVRLFETDPATLEAYQEQYRYLMVDEYQDTNHVQYRLVSALAAKYRNICVVGDEDQSIYSWRGADLGNLLDFQKHFPDAKLIRLEQNYRSTQNILSAAAQVIAHNTERLGKSLWTDRGNGPPILAFEASGDREEGDHIVRLVEWFHTECGVPLGEIAVFYRTNALSRLIEERLRGADILYRVVGGLRFYDRKEIKDLLAYLRVIANRNDSMALVRIINRPRRGIGDKTVEKIVAQAISEDQTFFEAIESLRAAGPSPKGSGPSPEAPPTDRPKGPEAPPALGPAAERKISLFLDQLNGWSELARSLSIVNLLKTVLSETGYIESLGDPAALEVISRRENIDELKNAITQFETEHTDATLRDFLEYTSLRTSVDEYEAGENSVSLMTIHCAKGLEFRVVLLIALEKNIFPHVLSLKEGGKEEERRLFYVGVTRAKDVLCLSFAANRFTQGEPRWNGPSAFLNEIPRALLRWPNEQALAEVQSEVERTAVAGASVPSHGRPRRRRKHPAERWPSKGDWPQSPQSAKAPKGRRPYESLWRTGQTIVHPTLGSGTITEVRGRGRSQVLVVEFEDGQHMEFMARFAHFKRH